MEADERLTACGGVAKKKKNSFKIISDNVKQKKKTASKII